MLEIHLVEAAILACFGAPEALDGEASELTSVLRVAPDEAWVVGPRARRGALLAAAEAWLAASDPSGIVVDQTDGWAIWAARGERKDELFGRLSVSPMPGDWPALVQGALSGVAGKVLFTREATYYMVPSPAGHHLHDRMRDTGDDLGVSETAARAFDAMLGKMPLPGAVPAR